MNTFTKALLLLFAFTFISCDKDFNTLGSDIVGDEHFNFEKYSVNNIVSYVKETNAVQTNNLPINALGIYDNPNFGTTKAHFVTQLELTIPDPNMGILPEITENDSVYIYIPYFSHIENTLSDGTNEYVLDSIYGDLNKSFKLKIFENKYFLNEFDPSDNNQSVQKYYSDMKPIFDANKGSVKLNSGSVSENDEFKFSKSEIKIYKTNDDGVKLNSEGGEALTENEWVVIERRPPGMWISLDKVEIKNKIIDGALDGKLYNNNVFKNYFKGLIFEVEENVLNEGAMALLDLSKAEMLVQFHAEFGTAGSTPTKSAIKFQLGYFPSANKKSISVNLFENSNVNGDYASALANSNQTVGDPRLYLKGGANGSVAFIDVFNLDFDSDGDGVFDESSELNTLRSNNWLINEANIVFYIDSDKMSIANQLEPNRVYLYDATNNKPIYDYTRDPTTSSNPKGNKYIHGGIIEQSYSGKGIKYKIRITDYINNVLNSDDETLNKNVRLGLVVTENINLTSNYYLKNPFIIGSQVVKLIPAASIINQLGTIIHGTQSTDPDKKLKLEIYYTEPN
jgi:hypothetical protein